MRLKNWWTWVNRKPLYLRWFIYFLLIRPIAEQYYNLKEISPLLSPLYWLGVLTLILSIIGILKGRSIRSGLDKLFYVWGFLIISSVLALYFGSTSLLSYLNYAIKLSLPVLVYFFLRVFIKNKSDFVGLLTTFLISCIFPISFLLVGLSGGEYFTEGRYAGAYADVFNNAFYLSIGIITLLYHYVLNRSYSNTLKVRNSYVVLGLLIVVMGLWVIKHIATVIVLLFVLAVFIYIVFRRHKGAAIFLVMLSLVFIVTTGDKFYSEVLNTRIEKEVEVIEGSRGITQGMHGRMSRWTWLSGEFRASPIYSQLFGFPYNMKYSNHMVGITPHNDFLRILFFTGYLGLLFYLLILVRIYRRIKHRDVPDKFFLNAILLATILYSVTTVPTFYPGYVNILMIAFAYSALPVSKPYINANS